MEFKDIVVDNDAIVNTEPKELPEEAHNIPQGVKPQLNPNPGYSEDGKTVPAIKTDLVEGERGTPVDVVTEPRPAFKSVQEIYNFLNGIKIKGKNLEDYIDSQGGVTEEELQAAVADLEEQIGAIPGGTKLYKHNISILGVKMSGASDTTKKDIRVNIISTISAPITSISSFIDLLDLEVSHTDFVISDMEYAEDFGKMYVFAIRDGDTYEGYSFKENTNYRVSVDMVESVYDELLDNVTEL